MNQPATYILASRRYGTLYIGATRDLLTRVWQHREGVFSDGFTKRYNVRRLVHYELFEDVQEARRRERQIKNWRRAWKINLIEQHNPEWRDLWSEIQR